MDSRPRRSEAQTQHTIHTGSPTDTAETAQASRNQPAPRREPGKKRRLNRAVLWVLGLVLCFLFYPRVQAVLRADSFEVSEGEVVVKRDINILLLGVDERNGDVGRSDTIMLLNYNAVSGRLHLMSVPRDTRVRLEKHGYQKINAAYAYGGTAMAKQAVSDLTGLHIDYFLKVDFEGFPKVVDALGGVTIDIETRMSYDDPYQDLHIHFEPGRQRLSGQQALEYVRWRGGVNADLGRVERQRDFLRAALARALSPVGLLRSPLVLHALRKCIDTDIPVLMQPGIALSIALAFPKGVDSCTMPGYPADIGGISYFIAEIGELQQILLSW
jgi:LCP family protein required for cell wall assembly